MLNEIKKFTCLTMLLCIFVSCKNDTEPVPPPPVRIINDFNPKSALPGASVTVTGTGFLPVDDVSLYAIVLNGELAEITEITETQIKFNVPAQAPPGKGLLTLHYGQAVANPGMFEVLIPETGRRVIDFNPKSALPGASITITGTGFLPVDDVSLYTIVLNGELAEITEITETQIKFNVPAQAPPGKGLLTLHYGQAVANPGMFEVLK